MKRIFASRALSSGALFFSTLFFTSCSSLWLQDDQTVDSVRGENPQGKTVSKEQYDELAKKYNELLNKSKTLQSSEAVETINVAQQQQKPLMGQGDMLHPSELVNQIDAQIPSSNLEGVDAFNRPQERPNAGPTSFAVKNLNSTDDIDGQISKLREVHVLVRANQFDKALANLKELEDSKEKQIAVRAKMMLGDLLFAQNEFDLASQVYEEIINGYAFSGFVIKALGKLVVCSEKLKQPEKQAKYYSLLHDFFEAT